MSANEKSPADPVALLPSAAAASGTIIVKVGAEGKEYTLHTEILKYYSGYFRGALSGAFKETVDGVVPLRDTEISAFEDLIDWIYAKRLPSYTGAKHNMASLDHMCELYVLADKLLVPAVKEKLMDYLFEVVYVIAPSCYTTSLLFDILPEKDPILQLWVDLYSIRLVTEQMPEWFAGHFSKTPREFLTRTVMRMNEMITGVAKQTLKRETYSVRDLTKKNDEY